MKPTLRWYELIFINSYWFGVHVTTGVITPILLPYLILLFMPPGEKNTHLATVRVIGLTIAMFVQPLAGMLSDRSTAKLGRRRPFIILSAFLSILFVFFIASSTRFQNIATFGRWPTSFIVLLVGVGLWQISSNLGLGALQGVIPDVVSEEQRGKASGVKTVLELAPVFLVILIGPLIDKGAIGLVAGILAIALLLTMLITVFSVQEKPLVSFPQDSIFEHVGRLVALTIIFVGVTQFAIAGVRSAGIWANHLSLSLPWKITLVGFSGLLGMAGAILIGVYVAARIGIGQQASQQKSFIWWVINRLLFLASVGSIQGFAQFFLRDVLRLSNPATMTTILLAVVALFLIPAAIAGGTIADKIGKKRLIGVSGLVASAGTTLLIFSSGFLGVILSGCIIGLATGMFMATSWALGTELAPKESAGRYLGISNLAGAGAGIVGAGIGGPLADFFNSLQPGLGYLILFSIYTGLFLISILALRGIANPVTLSQ